MAQSLPLRSRPVRSDVPPTTAPSAASALHAMSRRARQCALGLHLVAKAGRIGLALYLAAIAAHMVVGQTVQVPAIWGFLACVILSTLTTMGAERITADAERAVADKVLDWFACLVGSAKVADAQAFDPGDLCSRLTRHPAAAASAVISIQNTKAMSSLGMMMALAAMVVFSWQAALLLALGLPIMVGFFILVGGLTKRRAELQEAALQRLSASFAERIRCLPTLLSCHAVDREGARLTQALTDHEARSEDVLKVAFLNAGVLDFFSSLTIAMLAVFLGLGHLGLAQVPGFYGLTLAQSLSILVLAPEVFAPLRRYAEAYHAAAEGRATLASLETLVKARPALDPRLPAGHAGTRGLVLAHGGAVPDRDFPDRGLVALTGPSGCGKTSLLRALAGVDEPLAGHALSADHRRGWAAADAWLPGGTLDTIAAGPLGRRALKATGLLAEPRFGGDVAGTISLGGPDLSGGQRLRLSLARAVASDAETIYADEPTAKLDTVTAAAIRAFLREVAQDRLVIVATHDPALAAMATQRIDLGHLAADHLRRGRLEGGHLACGSGDKETV